MQSIWGYFPCFAHMVIIALFYVNPLVLLVLCAYQPKHDNRLTSCTQCAYYGKTGQGNYIGQAVTRSSGPVLPPLRNKVPCRAGINWARPTLHGTRMKYTSVAGYNCLVPRLSLHQSVCKSKPSPSPSGCICLALMYAYVASYRSVNPSLKEVTHIADVT